MKVSSNDIGLDVLARQEGSSKRKRAFSKAKRGGEYIHCTTVFEQSPLAPVLQYDEIHHTHSHDRSLLYPSLVMRSLRSRRLQAADRLLPRRGRHNSVRV